MKKAIILVCVLAAGIALADFYNNGGAVVTANEVTGDAASTITTTVNAATGAVVQITGSTMTGTLGLTGAANAMTWGGTNVLHARTGTQGGTQTVYWVVGGTNYHLLLP